MFIGHFAVAFAAKRVAPRPSLGWLVVACQFPDFIWPVFLLAGVERVRIVPGDTAFTPLAFDYYPWSHSLLIDLVWGTALGALYFALRRDRRGAVVIGALVVSHWVLDWITHRPDMPLAPGVETRVGLGLWNSVAATIVVEVGMYVLAVWIYARTTQPRDRIGNMGWWSLAALLVLVYIGNIMGPLPPNTRALAFGAMLMWVTLPWAWWVDRHRAVRPGPTATPHTNSTNEHE